MGRRTGGAPTQVPLLSSTWDEGRLWDHWMVVHFLSGAAGGFSNVFLKLSSASLWLLAIVLLIAWEIGEYAAGVREESENRALDLAVGLLGVLAATTLAGQLTVREQWTAFIGSTALLAVGCLLGWRAYRRRMAAG